MDFRLHRLCILNCCRRQQLKYIICAILSYRGTQIVFSLTLRASAPSTIHSEMLSSPYPVLTLPHSPAVPASTLYPATAARKGGSVAASLVDSCRCPFAEYGIKT